MAVRKKAETSDATKQYFPPSVNHEDREKELIAMAENLAVQRIMDGTASNQLLVHFLKENTVRARLEREKLEEEIKNIKAKTKAVETSGDLDAKYQEVLDTMKAYRGVVGRSEILEIYE